MSDVIYKCVCCGATVDTLRYDLRKPAVMRMAKAQLCFECDFWKNYSRDQHPGTKIVSGQIMRFTPIREWYNGTNQRKVGWGAAMDMKTGECVGNFDRLSLSVIPEKFRKDFPDEYRFISRDTYNKIRLRDQCSGCEMKGCYDRYNCYWYDVEQERHTGPWNELPTNYKPGMELCPSFINRETMFNCDNDSNQL